MEIQNNKILAFRSQSFPYDFRSPKKLGNPDNPYMFYFESLDPKEILSMQEHYLGEESNTFFHPSRWLDEETLNYVYFNLPKIEQEEWNLLVSLYHHFAFHSQITSNFKSSVSTQEVGTFTLLNIKENRIFFVLAEQVVSTGSVSWDKMEKLSAITLDGSEERMLESGWLADPNIKLLGYSHSHNTMSLSTPSSIDDDTELNMAGVHILLSTFKKNPHSNKPNFITTVTYTCRGERFLYQDVESLIPETSTLVPINQSVLDKVTITRPIPTYFYGGKTYPKQKYLPTTHPVQLDDKTKTLIEAELSNLVWNLHRSGVTFSDFSKVFAYNYIKTEFDILDTVFMMSKDVPSGDLNNGSN